MDNTEEKDTKAKPGPKPKEKVITRMVDPLPEEDANKEELPAMVKVLKPKRNSVNSIIGYEEKEVSRVLAEEEIQKWEDYKTTNIPGHSAWRDVEFSK
jgi:hypothetical protein